MGLIDNMKLNPFSIAVDGSNDTGLSKMNPLTVRIFDLERSRIVTRFLDKCTATASTAEALYSVVDGKLVDIENPWKYCTSVAVANTSVNTQFLEIQSSAKKFCHILQWVPLPHDP